MSRPVLILLFLLAATALASEGVGDAPLSSVRIVGTVRDAQGQAVIGARVALREEGEEEARSSALSQPDGSFMLYAAGVGESSYLLLDRPHFVAKRLELAADQLTALRAATPVVLGEITLERRITPGFWIATLVFVLVLFFIATGWLHNTLAALFGVSVLFAASYLGVLVRADLFIFELPRALSYIDWDVIFLIMGMMMVIAVVEHTGIFQWLAYAAYRGSRGRLSVLLVILMLIASLGSAVLDNVTTMLLMTPITVRIALTLKVNPLALLMPTVMASNVAGVSTLVGTPTNILIGSFADIGFNGFLANLTPGVLMALLGLIVYSQVAYRRDLAGGGEGTSPKLLDKLEASARISEPGNLRKAGWVGLGMLVLFVFGEGIHLVPAVTAVMGATALLLWIRPDIEAMVKAVDWTTLVFFMMLFMVVGGIQEVGLISQIAVLIADLVGKNLVLAMLVVIWSGALLSTVIANIPFTAAMLPVIGFLTANIPGAESQVLFFCLSVGAAMGGNGSLIGASANMVTAGIAERAGYPITYGYFLRKGMPALLVTVGLATLWLLFRFLLLA